MNSSLKHCSKCGNTYPATVEYWVSKHDKLLAICRACRSAAARAWYAANKSKVAVRKAGYSEVQKEALRAVARQRYASDPSKAIAATRAWQAANKASVRQASIRWRENNKEIAYQRNVEWLRQHPQATRQYNINATNTAEKRAYKSEASLRWAKQNPAKANALKAKRRASKMQRTPAWLTEAHFKAIRDIYMQASQLSKTTGVLHHVDHIVPLQGKIVSGLHVPWNLRVVTATVNLTKNNKLEDFTNE